MDNGIKNFLNNYWELLENKKLNELYKVFSNSDISWSFSVSILTEILLEVGINPLEYFVDEIPYMAFDNVKLPDKDLIIPEGIVKIGDRAFSGCKCKSIKLPSTLEKINSNAFSGSSIPDNLVIPSTCVRIESGAFFYNHNIKSIEIKNPNCIIGYNSLRFSPSLEKLESVTIPARYKSAMNIRNIFGYKNTLELRKRVKFTWI